MQSKYSNYADDTSSTSSDSGSTDYENVQVKFTPHASVEATVGRVFGSDSDWGQSIAIMLNDVLLTDGALYYDPEKDKYKLFSLADAAGMSQADAIERDLDLSVDDVNTVLTKTYFGEEKTYELVAARVEGVEGEIEATSKSRPNENSDFEYHDGEPVEVPNFISFFDGNEDYGPSAAAKGIVRLFTERGADLIDDEDDLDAWLVDTSGDDLMRDDLEDRRVEFFLVRNETDEGNPYFSAVLVDAKTGEQITPNNRVVDDSGNERDATGTKVAGDATYPAPVANFIESASSLDLTPSRAEELLNDTIADSENALTEELVEDAGGTGAVIQEVTQ